MAIPNQPVRRKKKGGSKIINCFLIIFILVMIAGIGGYFGFRSWYSEGLITPNSDNSEIVVLNIAQGSTSKEIGELLYNNGLISDKNIWNIYIKLNNPNLLAAEYKLPKNLTLKQVVETLSQPPEVHLVWVTFPEGLTMYNLTDILQKRQSDFIDENFLAAEFLDIAENPDNYSFSSTIQTFLDEYKPAGKPLEGFLYPNTYSFESDYDAMQVIEFLLSEFISQTAQLNIEGMGEEFYDVLTLASVVDKESLGPEDRPLVASVFNNRLEDGWMLQSDATVNYATGKSERRPSLEDTKFNSPYNTYQNTGLPPTPICNPRLASIQESLNPVESDYYFFIHEEDGTAHFGKNQEEHNLNICKYLDKTC